MADEPIVQDNWNLENGGSFAVTPRYRPEAGLAGRPALTIRLPSMCSRAGRSKSAHGRARIPSTAQSLAASRSRFQDAKRWRPSQAGPGQDTAWRPDVFFAPELDRLFVAARADGGKDAAILVFRPLG